MSKFLVVLPSDLEDKKYKEFEKEIQTKFPHTQNYQLDKHTWGVSVADGFSYTVAEQLGIGEKYSGFVFPITSMAGRYKSTFVEWYNG